MDAQYREQEIGWRILEALTAPGAGPEVLGGLTGQSVGEIPLESAELSAVATELAQMGLIDSRRTADRLHAHVRLSPDGRRLVTSQRAPFPVHLDGTTPSASNASATTYQFINHGHVKVNGRKVNIGSYKLKVGDVVEVKESSKQLTPVLEASQLPERDVPDFIEVDHSKMTAKYARTPGLSDVPFPVQMEPHLIVEFYSR